VLQLKTRVNLRKIATMYETRSEEFIERFRVLIRITDLSQRLADPLKEAMTEMLETSSARLKAAGASILVRKEDSGALTFLAATGEVADQVIGLEIPAGKGVAGFVLMSGQPMAISEPDDESGFYAEVDKATGFSTEHILAVPLRFRNDVIGVLEYVNRAGDEPATAFTPDEMDLATVYAESVAALVNAFFEADLLYDLSSRVAHTEEERKEVQTWLRSMRDVSSHGRALELAALINELSSMGDAEIELCRKMLESIIQYSRSNLSGLEFIDE